jgi:hypothetical protein
MGQSSITWEINRNKSFISNTTTELVLPGAGKGLGVRGSAGGAGQVPDAQAAALTRLQDVV